MNEGESGGEKETRFESNEASPFIYGRVAHGPGRFRADIIFFFKIRVASLFGYT